MCLGTNVGVFSSLLTLSCFGHFHCCSVCSVDIIQIECSAPVKLNIRAVYHS